MPRSIPSRPNSLRNIASVVHTNHLAIPLMGDIFNGSLPEDLQEVVTSVSASYIDKACQMGKDENRSSCDLGELNSVEFITSSAEERALWEDTLQTVLDDYVAARVDAGESQSEVEGWLDYITERVDYWTQEQIDASIPFPP